MSLPMSFAPIIRALMNAQYLPSVTSLGTEGVWQFKNLPYHHDGDTNPKHTLDVMMPAFPFPRKPQPVLMFWHGGAWQRGDKDWSLNLNWNVGVAAARAGAVGVVCNYRLAPQIQYPELLTDCYRAVRWVQQNIGQYGGNPNKIVWSGHSAGAHLALRMASQTGSQLASENITPPSAVIGLCGVYNVLRLGKSPFGPALVEPAFGKDPQVWRAASPVYACTKDSVLQHVPTLLVNAQEDFHLNADAEELELSSRACRTPLPTHTSGSDREAGPDAQCASLVDRVAHRLATSHGPALHSVDTPGRQHTSVLRYTIPHCNHGTLIGAVGQPNDITTSMIGAVVAELQ